LGKSQFTSVFRKIPLVLYKGDGDIPLYEGVNRENRSRAMGDFQQKGLVTSRIT
jgi:hypothetical protein